MVEKAGVVEELDEVVVELTVDELTEETGGEPLQGCVDSRS